MKILQKQGLKFKLSHSLESVKKVDGKVMLSIKDTNTNSLKQIDADVVLIAVGRKPNTSGLGLAELGLATDKHGFIEINNKFETSIKNIYAIGDVIKGPMLAHKAEEDGVAAVEIINGEAGHVDYNLVPGIIYTAPEVAVIGKTEEELKKAGVIFQSESAFRDVFATLTVVDDEKRFVTGQNQNSGHETAYRIMEILNSQ